jgi:hypothetical protein
MATFGFGRAVRLVSLAAIAATAFSVVQVDPTSSHAAGDRASSQRIEAPSVASNRKHGSGLLFRSIRRSSPPQRISVLRVAPWADVRATFVRAGTKRAPYATVSSTVTRLHALAGVNGFFVGPVAPSPMLVVDGRPVVGTCNDAMCGLDPRTGLGITYDGSLLLVTVDGRRPGAVGMTLAGFASLMRSLGAVWAVNLDGGASSTMVVGRRVVNTPSDLYGERRVLTALVLLPSSRPGVGQVIQRLLSLDRRIVAPGMGSIEASIYQRGGP